MIFDVVIVGGGPGGLSAAMGFGRSRRRALICDAGPRRNAAAAHLHNFVTRDGTPPTEFRRIGREQLAPYASVEVRDAGISEIHGERGAFTVRVGDDTVTARRILLATGMVDEPPTIPGMQELWGHHVFICPYCHGWEIRDRAFGYIASHAEMMMFGMVLRGWTDDVIVFTDGKLVVPADARAQLASARVQIEERPIARLTKTAVELADGTAIPRDNYFAHPKQHQVALVQALGLALDDKGFVKVEMSETSRPGIYAAGDLTTPMQSAIAAASAGSVAVGMINHGLIPELAMSGAI